MNREIKFRGKTNYGHWVEGSFMIDNFGHNYIISYPPNGVNSTCSVIPETVGQFIGLFDKTGKEIYEGNIFTTRGKFPKVVKYILERAAFCIAHIDEVSDTWHDPWQMPNPRWWTDFDGCIEIIGNIHDNHELLTGSGYKEKEDE